MNQSSLFDLAINQIAVPIVNFCSLDLNVLDNHTFVNLYQCSILCHLLNCLYRDPSQGPTSLLGEIKLNMKLSTKIVHY